MREAVASVALVGCVAAVGLACERARWDLEYRQRLVAVLALLDHAPNASVAALAGHEPLPLVSPAPARGDQSGARGAMTDFA